MANDGIGEKHDDVGEGGGEVCVEVLIVEVLDAGSWTFSVKEHILLIVLPSEIAYIPAAEAASAGHHSPCHH